MVQSSSHTLTFVPSKALIEMFSEGARQSLRRAQTSGDRELHELLSGSADDLLDLSPGRISDVISTTVQNVLVSLGGRRQIGVVESDVIAEESFTQGAEREILEMLPIDKDNGHEFCQLLLGELRNYLRAGGVIAGDWGQVRLAGNGNVAFEITQAPRRRTTSPYPPKASKAINF